MELESKSSDSFCQPSLTSVGTCLMSSEGFCTLPAPDPFLSPSRSEAGAENGTARHRLAEWRGPAVRRSNPKNVDGEGQALPARDSCNCFPMASRIELCNRIIWHSD